MTIYRARQPGAMSSPEQLSAYMYAELSRLEAALDFAEPKTLQLQNFTNTIHFPERPLLGELLRYNGQVYTYTAQGWRLLATTPPDLGILRGTVDDLNASLVDDWAVNYEDAIQVGSLAVDALAGTITASRDALYQFTCWLHGQQDSNTQNISLQLRLDSSLTGPLIMDSVDITTNQTDDRVLKASFSWTLVPDEVVRMGIAATGSLGNLSAVRADFEIVELYTAPLTPGVGAAALSIINSGTP